MGLQENLRTETVERLEIRQPVVAQPDSTVQDAVRQMRERNLGCVVVVDPDGKPVGIFTESMLIDLIAHHREKLKEPLSDHMTGQIPWVRNTDPITDVLQAMQLKNIRLLCVVDQHDRLIGITGQRGLMEYIAEHFPGDVNVQRIGMAPWLGDREGA